MRSTSRLWAVALIVFGVGLAVYVFKPASSEATQQPVVAAAGAAKYTVIDTEGTNLLVVDNAKNTLYFYTVDPDKTVGDDLKLRGSLDLNTVGQPVLKPVPHKHDK
jgi:hypothetical protein